MPKTPQARKTTRSRAKNWPKAACRVLIAAVREKYDELDGSDAKKRAKGPIWDAIGRAVTEECGGEPWTGKQAKRKFGELRKDWKVRNGQADLGVMYYRWWKILVLNNLVAHFRWHYGCRPLGMEGQPSPEWGGPRGL